MRRGRGSAVWSAILILATVLPACSKESRPARQAEAAVDPAQETTLSVPGGPTVRIPAGAVSATGTLRISAARDTTSVPEQFEAAGDAWLITLDGAELTGSVALEVPVSFAPAEDEVVVLAHRSADVDGWSLSGGTYDASRATVSVEVDHLSIWRPLKWVADKLKSALRHSWEAVFNDGLFGAEQPSCPDEQAARVGGFEITSDRGDQIKWCVGREPDGSRIVKVANNRRHAVAVGLPPGIVLRDRPTRAIAIKYIGNAIDEYLHDQEGRPAVVLGPGDTATLAVQPNARGAVVISTEPSGLTYLTDILDIAIDMYGVVLAALPGGPSTKAEAVEKMGGLLVANTNCLLRQFDSGGAFGPRAPFDPVTLARGVAELTFGCMGAIAKQVFTGALAAIVAVVVGIPTGLAVGLIGAGDFFRDLFSGRYSYRIRLVVPAPPVEPCPTNTRCFGTGNGDLDGDGKTDRVGLFTRAASSGFSGGLTLRVVYGTGEFVDREEGTVSLYAPKLLGVTDIDSDRKAEIVYFRDGGAHSRYGTILHHENGALRATLGTDGEQYQLTVDGSVTSNAGVTCRDTTGDGRAELIASSFNVNASNDGYVGGTVTYQWSGIRLVKIADQALRFPVAGGRATSVGPPPEAQPYVGVNCPGLSSG